MRLRVGKLAQRQAARIDRWWVQNRPDAPDLFASELADAFDAICEHPGAGIRWATPRRPELRRMLLPRTENHVYFQLDEAGRTVHVLAIWGAPRGRGPRL